MNNYIIAVGTSVSQDFKISSSLYFNIKHVTLGRGNFDPWGKFEQSLLRNPIIISKAKQ